MRPALKNSGAAPPWQKTSVWKSNVISAGEIKERLPHLNTEGVTGGVFLPGDGQVNPIDVTQAYAAGARGAGAKIFENTKVIRILTDGKRATGVETASGTIMADMVLIAGGMWSRTDRFGYWCSPSTPCR